MLCDDTGVQMSGYISTSLDWRQALAFATKGQSPDKVSVLQEILWLKSSRHVRLDGPEWSAYWDECEVLLFDGQKFRVENVERDVQVPDPYVPGLTHTVVKITLRYDAEVSKNKGVGK